MRHLQLRSTRRQSGFTLLEMLAVIVLLGIVATIVVRQIGAVAIAARLAVLTVENQVEGAVLARVAIAEGMAERVF